MWDGRPGQFVFGVVMALRWVGTSGLQGTEWQTNLGCDLELVCDEAVLWRGYVVIGT